MPQPYKIKTGERYGHWKVLEMLSLESLPGKRRRHYCKARCMKCGNVYRVLTASLVSNRSTQCSDCRYRCHGEKVRVAKNGVAIRFKISADQHSKLVDLFGGNRNSAGRGVRKAISVYRKLEAPFPTDIPLDEKLFPTSMSIDRGDAEWLEQNHNSIHHGIYSAVHFFLNNDA